MAFLELAENRFSVRKFKDEPVEDEKIERILRAAQVAPTGCNYQEQRLYVLKSKEARDKLTEVTKMTYNAPLIILVCYNEDEAWKSPTEDFNTGTIDCSIVATHMMLQAFDDGVGSVWIRGYDTKKVEEAFGLPHNEHIVSFIDFGYPQDGVVPSAMHSKNKQLDEFVKYL